MLLRHNMSRATLFLALLLLAPVAQAQSVAAIPANPVAGVPFVIHGVIPGCTSGFTVTVSGSTIDVIALPGSLCIDPVVFLFDVPAGPLPAGTYTIRLLRANSPTVIATATIMVVADVPALDLRLLVLLAAAIVVIGMVRLGAG